MIMIGKKGEKKCKKKGKNKIFSVALSRRMFEQKNERRKKKGKKGKKRKKYKKKEKVVSVKAKEGQILFRASTSKHFLYFLPITPHKDERIRWSLVRFPLLANFSSLSFSFLFCFSFSFFACIVDVDPKVFSFNSLVVFLHLLIIHRQRQLNSLLFY